MRWVKVGKYQEMQEGNGKNWYGGDGASGADDAVDLRTDFVGGERGELVGVGSSGSGGCG